MKIHLVLLFFAVLSLAAAEQPLTCQMLLSEKEQKDIGLDRQRAMYPRDRAKRLAMMSLRDGMAFLDRKDLDKAMREFNRAWRFDPANPFPYWMAGIVRGIEAAQLTDPGLRKKCYDDSSSLFGKADVILRASSDGTLKENLAMDRAEALIQYGVFLKKDHPEQAEQRFREAETLLAGIVPKQDTRGKQVAERIRQMRGRIRTARQ